MNSDKLEYDTFYHIYSHGAGGRNIFREAENYAYFLHLYDAYIEPVADTFAWALMPNHLHLLVKMKTQEQVVAVSSGRVSNPVRGKNNRPLKTGTPSQQFSKLFNAYAQAFNKWHGSRGGLFERPFKRKIIDNMPYLKHVVLYIHNNPVHHGFCTHPLEYPWTSDLSCLSLKPSKLKREAVVGWFNDKADFITRHRETLEFGELEGWLGM